MKALFTARRLPICEYRAVLRRRWEQRSADITAELERALGYPMFVKPANLGSSVGISKAKDAVSLRAAMELAGSYDRKIVIEAAVPEAREIECAVLGNDDPQASVPGEVIPGREFYDYEAKYLDDTSQTIVPADLPTDVAEEIQRLSIAAFRAIDCAGMARVDFLVSRSTGAIVLNEINTIPGFTTISMYSKMWAASGVSYPMLLDRLVELALERHAAKQQLRTSLT
jgi:D-alanine-D-alanine ligase